MNRKFDFKIILFFILLTVSLTIGVIGLWEVTLRPVFFAWVDARYPGDANTQLRWNIKQRVEHVFISFAVDALVVTLLLRVVHRQQRQLRESEERYRALFEQARDGIGLVRLSDYRLIDANSRACEILGVPPQNCIDQDIRKLFRTAASDPPPELLLTANSHSSSQPPVENELVIQRAQGQPLPVSVSVYPLSTGRRPDGDLVSARPIGA